MKIGLGTVQWGLDYGISNIHGIPSDRELKSIVRLASQYGINLFDTAAQYGNAEQRLGKYINKSSRIVSKINSKFDKSLESQIQGSLNFLNIEQLYAYLFHSSKDLIDEPSLWNQMQKLKIEGKVKKIGYSLYNPEELEKLFKLKFIPDLIQIPFNIIDRRFETYFKKLNELNIEIHVRSIFLQGLLLNFEMMKNSKFSKWNLIWNKYKNWLSENDLSPIEACISHALHFKEISNVIIGVENSTQLMQIINATKKKKIEAPTALISTDEGLINPLSWL